jgi:filamentous hemagglutinin family protein
MQAAANAAALTSAVSLGSNPNNPAQTLPLVPDAQSLAIIPASGASVTGPGLQIAVDANGNPVLWQGAGLPSRSSSNANDVTITQSQQQAYLQWQTFDIGKGTKLTFDQSAGGSNVSNWIAFNYIRDPSGRPSQILGSLVTAGPADSSGNPTTGGQVYVLNSNGIIFGGSSQVNAYALVASSLPINTNLVQSGLLNNPDDQFLFTTTSLVAGKNGPTAAFNPSAASSGIAPAQTPYLPDGSGGVGTTYGDILVEPGATITAPSTSANVGGRVALVGPNVTNAGTIDTPDGQTILAAGLQVGWVAHSTGDASLRGLDVYIGSIGDSNSTGPATAGVATNADSGQTLFTGMVTAAAGLIEAPRADVTLAGAVVNQLGVVDSSTSVAYNGRVDLLASYDDLSSGGNSGSHPFFQQKTGTVTLGGDSLTQILPELDSTATIAATSLSLPSTVDITGSTIVLSGSGTSNSGAGAILLAPSGAVTATAGSWHFTNGGIDPSTGLVENSSAVTFVYDSGQISLGAGATVDVSGSEDVSASVQENILAVQLLGPQLADSPLQRTGPLRGLTIYVDIRDTGTYNGQPWVGTPLADTSGYVGLIPHTVGELTTSGGSVTLNAGNSVSLAQGSTVDVAGGWTDYQGGMVETTKVLYQGQVIDISQATPNLAYSGIYSGTSSSTDSKWGTSTSATNPLPLATYDPGYIQGGGGGSLSITSGSVALSGTLFGRTFAGPLQLKPFVPYSSPALSGVVSAGIDPSVWEIGSRPAPGSLSLTFEKEYQVQSEIYAWYLPSPPDIYFLPAAGAVQADPAALVLSPGLTNPNATSYGGFGNLTIDDSADNYQIGSTSSLVIPTDPSTGLKTLKFGTITVGANSADPDNVSLIAAPGGSITLSAGNVTIDGGVSLPGGALSVTANDFWENSPFLLGGIALFDAPAYNAARGNLVVAPGVMLNASGLIVDTRSSPGNETAQVTAGGSINLLGSAVSLGSGAILSVNGGATIGATGAVAYGNAGSIDLGAGRDPAPGLVNYPILGGTLSFDAASQLNLAPSLEPLQGYSGSAGGQLTLVTPLVQVGATPGAAPPPGTLVLDSSYASDGLFHSFFDQGGFSKFTIAGIGQAETDPTGTKIKDSSGNVLYYPALHITAGSQVDPTLIFPRVKQLEVTVDSTSFGTAVIDPLPYQNTPASLSFQALGAADQSGINAGFATLVVRGDLVLDAGAVVETDPQTGGGGVTLSGNTVAVLGSVVAPGGAISVTGGSNSLNLFAQGVVGTPTVDLGPDSLVSAAGTTVLTKDPFGRVYGEAGYLNTGTVLPGGSVTLTGNIVTEGALVDSSTGATLAPGAVIDVSGWSDANDFWGLLEMAPQFSGTTSASKLSQSYVPTVVATNGGSITMTGKQSIFPDAALRAFAGGPTALGGTLSVTGPATGVLYTTLQVTEDGPTVPASFYGTGETAIGHAVLDAGGNPVTGAALGNFAAASFTDGGFDSLSLHGIIDFVGNVTLAAKGGLSVADSGILSATEVVNLSGSEVSIGQGYIPPTLAADIPPPIEDPNSRMVPYPPTPGTGELFVTSGSKGAPGLVNIGNLTLQGISQTAVTSVDGDVRGFGTFDVSGPLKIVSDSVYPPTSGIFTIDAYDYSANGATVPGSVTFLISDPADARPVPLSAGGTLSVYATQIDQGGLLEAPLGVINLGWNGTGVAPTDPITGKAVEATQSLTVDSGSVTSVSGSSAGAASGSGLPIPYGINLNGTSWIDPAGADITSSGPVSKEISIAGTSVTVSAGAVVNASGGGNLYAYQFIPGVGGTNDILSSSSTSFAVVPGYQAQYAPDAAFNSKATGTESLAQNLLYPDSGYTSGSLAAGEQIHIDLGNGAGVQNYTLLPARYALLPGAFLITAAATPQNPSAAPVAQPDGSTVSLGYLFNAFDPSQPLFTQFKVTPESVVRTQADYGDSLANTFFAKSAGSSGSVSPLLPVDGGQVVLSATTNLSLLGSLESAAGQGGRGGSVDISSTQDIVINATGTAPAEGSPGSNTLYLSSAELTATDSGSLVIGGTVGEDSDGEVVTVTTPSLTVDNAGAPLQASDIILVANQSILVASNAQIEAVGTAAGPAPALQITDPVLLQPAKSVSMATSASQLSVAHGGDPILLAGGIPSGDSLTASVSGTYTEPGGSSQAFSQGAVLKNLPAGTTLTLSGAGRLTALGTGGAVAFTTGDGALLRVSASPSAPTSRSNVAALTSPDLQVGQGATISGSSVTLDSTNMTAIDPSVNLGGAVALSSGQISLQLDSTVSAGSLPASLVLTPALLLQLQANASSLSLVSYGSIDTYGSGTVGSAGFADLSLHAAEIRGFQAAPGGTGVADSGGTVEFLAKTITLDDSPGGVGPGPVSGAVPSGSIEFRANTIDLGSNALAVDQFASVALTAGNSVTFQGAGSLSVPANLTVTTPLVSGTSAATQALTAGGSLLLAAGNGTASPVSSGLGASLSLRASSLSVGSVIDLASGSISLEATGPSAAAGSISLTGTLDVSGSSATFNGATSYADAGRVSLTSDNGNVSVASGGSVDVAAASGGGSAGALSISAVHGTFSVASETATPVGASGGAVPTLDGLKGQSGSSLGGTFSLDALSLADASGAATTSLGLIEGALGAGGFSQAQSFRLRSGDVDIDGPVVSRSFGVSADNGNVDVTSGGAIEASGPTGGVIELDASGSVTLDGGSRLSVAGLNYNDAGKGGTVTLQAGSYTGGGTAEPADSRNTSTGLFAGGAAVDISAGSTIDLSVTNAHALQLNPRGNSSVTPPGAVTIPGGLGLYFPVGTPGNDLVSLTSGGTITGPDGSVTAFSASAQKPFVTSLASGTTVVLATSGTVAYAGGTGGSIPVGLPFSVSGSGALNLAPVNTTELGPYYSGGVLTLVAPQVLDGSGNPTDVRIDPIAGTVTGESSIVAEGLNVLDLTTTPGAAASIDVNAQSLVQANSALFAGGYILNPDGSTTPVAGNTAAIEGALTSGEPALSGLLHVRPAEEIVNSSGDLDLTTTWDFAEGATYSGSGGSVSPSNWSSLVMPFRYGPANNEPGSLILRASGNVVLGVDQDNGTFGSLNDGFAGFDGYDNVTLMDAVMLPAGYRSWSFRLVSGADIAAADSTQTLPMAVLSAALGGAGTGSIILGNGAGDLLKNLQNNPWDYYQTIRTGTGDIGLFAGQDVQVVNTLFSVYTAGTQTAPAANFNVPLIRTYVAQFSSNGGDVTISAKGSIEHLNSEGLADSSLELPLNWLASQGAVDPTTGQYTVPGGGKSVDSTAWWVNFSDYYEGIGALGGGNVSLEAGGDISNVDAAIATNERTTYQVIQAGGSVPPDKLASDQASLEVGGGDLRVSAGGNIDGGVYYVERGRGLLDAGGSIHTNATRTTLTPAGFQDYPTVVSNPNSWLPTTLFLGDGDFDILAGGSVLLGPVVNPFLLPESSAGSSTFFFSTYGVDSLAVQSLTGSVTLKDDPDADQGGGGGAGSLADWLAVNSASDTSVRTAAIVSQSWIGLNVPQVSRISTLLGIMPSSLLVTAFDGDVNLVGSLTLMPSSGGQLTIASVGSVNGFQPNSVNILTDQAEWGSSTLNLSDADPMRVPGLAVPDSSATSLANLNLMFGESGSLTGAFAVLQTQQALHDSAVLHSGDAVPLAISAASGDISGLTLYSSKSSHVFAGQDITDVSLYIQNDRPGDITSVTAGGSIIPYDPNSPLRLEAQTAGNVILVGGSSTAGPSGGTPTAGDIQIGGPGTLEVLAGGNIDLGETVGTAPTNGTSVGVTSVGNSGNPSLPFQGADVVMAAGLVGVGSAGSGIAGSKADVADFISQFIDPATAPANAARYLPELAEMLGVPVASGATPADLWASLLQLPSSSPAELRDLLAVDAFYIVLRDSGRDHNDPTSPLAGTYDGGYAAVAALFPGYAATVGSAAANPSSGTITLATRLVETKNGGNISLLAPGGGVTVGRSADPQKPDQGVITEQGGDISVYAQDSIGVGTSRIFTLFGGNEIIWSSLGDIAAGSGSKTVHSAPPTRVLINPQSATVENDLAGLATGAGIGVLATLTGVAPGSVDLIAPVGTIDAGDAGIRASGTINISALHVLNANNIQAGGAATGVPVSSAPNIGGLAAASSSAAASASSAAQVANQQSEESESQQAVIPSIITIEVLGYGGGEDVSYVPNPSSGSL